MQGGAGQQPAPFTDTKPITNTFPREQLAMINFFSVNDVDRHLTRALRGLENFCFRFRTPFLIWLAVFTVFMGYFAIQLRMEAGFEKQMPTGHEYIETFQKYRNDVLGANRLNFVV